MTVIHEETTLSGSVKGEQLAQAACIFFLTSSDIHGFQGRDEKEECYMDNF